MPPFPRRTACYSSGDRLSSARLLLYLLVVVTAGLLCPPAQAVKAVKVFAVPALGNYPDTSIPLSANTTVSPDAAPTNASSINVSTTTGFQGKLEGDPTTGIVRVTDAHPAGTYAVTVKVFNNDATITTRSFTLTVTNTTACSPITFAPWTEFSVGIGPSWVAVGDFNGDGKQDLVTVNLFSDDGSILLGDGVGGFSAGGGFEVGSKPRSVAAGDFNGDGRQDLAVANGDSGTVSILLGNGSGSFGVATNFGVSVGIRSVAVGDFNGDGRQDLALADELSNNAFIMLGNGAGGFGAAASFGVGANPFSATVGDFNGDGNHDLAVANAGSNNVSILLGNGAGSFGAATNFGVGASGGGPVAIAVGDFDGDGKQDLGVANFDSHNVSILIGNGAGSFSPATTFGVAGSAPQSIAVGDFNGDGLQDLVVANYFSDNVSIMLGNGSGDFGLPFSFGAGSFSGSVAVGDFNGDSQQDLAVANDGSQSVSVLLRNCPTPIPVLGNYPDTSVPLGSNATVTPTAAPVETSRINVSTSTNFKGKLEGDPATGVVRVTDAHPAGTYPVTVTAFSSVGATSAKIFTLTVTTPPTCDPLSFIEAADLDAGDSPGSVVVGDFNGDGQQDLAVTNSDSNNVSVFLGNGPGSFSAATNFSAGTGPTSVAVGDFNSDGRQDLAVANILSSNVSILLGNGAGSFSPPVNFSGDASPFGVAVGDFNRDEQEDLVVTNYSSSNVSILFGNGAGSFSAPVNLNVGANPVSVTVGDFNGDDRQDLAVANESSANVSILLGNGVGGFSAAVNFAAGSFPSSITVGDFNSDSQQDLAVANASTSVAILLGNGAGSFGAAANFAVGSVPVSVAVGDFNGDGKQDLVTANQFSANVSILLGDGLGSFSAATNFATGTRPASVAAGDFNSDGQQDLAVPNLSENNVSILLRDCPPVDQSPQITCPDDISDNNDPGQFSASVPFTVTATGVPPPNIECKVGSTVITSPHTFGVGTATVQCKASNGVNPDASCSFSVTVNDTEAPVISCPVNKEVNTDPGACSAAAANVNIVAATANDNGPAVTITGVRSDGQPLNAAYPKGVTTITWTATDTALNAASCQQTITVIDNTKPTVTAPAPTSASANSSCQAAIPNVISGSRSSDNCNGIVRLSQSPAAGRLVGLGTHTITVTATDAAGNTKTATTTFTVKDTTAPVITLKGVAVMTIERTRAFVDPGATAADACAGDLSRAIVKTGSVNTNAVGTYLLTYTVSDGRGNSARATRTVKVIDTSAPTISCPMPITVDAATEFGAPVTYALPVAMDAGSPVPVTCSKSPGSSFPFGKTTVQCAAKDASRNTASCTFTVTVRRVRDTKLDVLNQLIALRAHVTDRQDGKRLDEAIKDLTKAVEATLWLDSLHPKPRIGEQVFDKEAEVVKTLGHVLKDKRSQIADTLLQTYISRLVTADRVLALVAIKDAKDAKGNPGLISQGTKELARGDEDAPKKDYDKAIKRYGEAWKQALKAIGKS